MTAFKDITGQERIVANLKDAVKTGRAAHAYIFDGEKGMGKRTLAGIFAKALLCEEPLENRDDAEPCGHCHSCIMAESGSHPDIITLVPEKESSIGVDDIRSQVVNDVVIKPYCSSRKIYIIPDADLMTEAAENALLKTLEEPPSYAVILILSENKYKLLPTILSRAVCFSLRGADIDRIKRYFRDNTESLDRIRRAVTGAREMTDTGISAVSAEVAANKEERDGVISFCLSWFRDILFLKAGGEEKKLIFPDELREIRKASEYYSFERINNIIEEIKTARSRLNSNVNPENTFELLFMTMR